MHIKQCNYQAFIWRKSHLALPSIPSSIGHGWEISEGVLEATWTEGELLPQELRDLIVEHPATDESDDDMEVPELNNILDIIFE